MLVVLGMVVLIVILVGYIALFKTPAAGKIKAAGEKAEELKKKAPKRGRKTKLAYCPVISYKSPGETAYERVEMSRPKITIGSGKGCDIRLDDATVEKVHATIEKVVKGNEVYYEFINLSKCNPAEFLNSDKGGERDYLGYKKGIVIGRAEGFKIGETKLFVEIPVRDKNRLSATERVFLNKMQQPEDEETKDTAEVAVVPDPAKTITYDMGSKQQQVYEKTLVFDEK